MAEVRLRAGREKSLRHRHPWVYSGAIERISGSPEAGDIVDVVDHRGALLGRGYCNEKSRITVRMLTWDDSAIDDAFWHARVLAAVRRRDAIFAGGQTNGCRLVHAEADLLPGLVVDRYADVAVIQFLTAGVERVRGVVLDALVEATQVAGVFERSDTASRVREGLAATAGAVHGTVAPSVEFLENSLRFEVNVEGGQKTGFYLDQRDNRAAVAALAGGRAVLDAFCHTGAFGVYAADAGARSVTFLDSSAASLEAARANFKRNAHAGCEHEIIQADAFEHLRAMRTENRRFDLIILDPPRFATNRHQLDAALRAYKDVNRVALEVLAPDGILVSFSCSQAVDAAAFSRAIAWAGLDAGRDIQIIRRLGQGSDHPVLAAFPESEYLKGVVCGTI